MHPTIIRLGSAFLFLLLSSALSAAELPRSLACGPCKTPPSIDGVIGDDEWKDAKSFEFDMPVIRLKAVPNEKWTCKLWVMNSANGLYIALRVPDATLNKSLNPFDFDFALLAFCRGKELAADDDRKAIGPGLYIDKHLTQPGKDVDDKHPDGRGMMVNEKGIATFEWAVPLNCADKEDIQIKAGDKARFNLAYFDAFQVDVNKTAVGVAYGGTLDKADNWGTLELAGDVKDDGGAAFKGPAWVAELFKTFDKLPAKRLKLLDSNYLPGQQAVKANVEFVYLDPQGKEKTAKGKIYLPDSVRASKTKIPLYFNAGYEADDGASGALVARGFAVVTPSALESNPLIRTPNPDIALLHMVRSMPFLDDARVVIGGGSAGGYATLMLAAETFPLGGAIPNVPPVNWGYNGAYFFKQKDVVTEVGDDKKPKVPVLATIATLLGECTKVYGDDYGGNDWYASSPIAHVKTITSPVLVTWTTADVLVPIDQVSKEWVRPFEEKAFPKGFTMDPDKLNESKEGRLRFMDVLSDKEYEVFLHKEEDIKARVVKPGTTATSQELPFSRTKQWSINIWDEGKPEPAVGHTKYAVLWSHNAFMDHAARGKIAASQLTATKLERLMDRYAGKEWLPSKLKRLDIAESERADVIRGLKTYVSAGAEHAKQFADLYDKLPSEKKVLEAEVLKVRSRADDGGGMLERFGGWGRKASLGILIAGVLIAFWTEATADIPVGRTGKPKPPILQQRLHYSLLLGGGLPGLVWGVVRVCKGQQRTPWE